MTIEQITEIFAPPSLETGRSQVHMQPHLLERCTVHDQGAIVLKYLRAGGDIHFVFKYGPWRRFLEREPF